MSEDNKDLGDKAKDALENAKEGIENAAEKAGEKASELKEDAKGFAEDANEKASEFADSAKETASDFKEGAKDAFENLSNAGGDNKKVLAGVLAILLGSLGVHKFILGYQKEGLILLGATVVGYATLCIAIGAFILMATGIIGLIEGIIYLTKSDEEFHNTYQANKRPWF